jgi:hypothetical protein
MASTMHFYFINARTYRDARRAVVAMPFSLRLSSQPIEKYGRVGGYLFYGRQINFCGAGVTA